MEKALSPEEKPIIENIISLFQQLLSLQGDAAGAAPAEEQIVDMAQGEVEDPNQEIDVAKAIDETGDTKAEDRLNNQTPITDTSLADLKKSLTALLGMQKRTPVQKSASNDSALLSEIKKIGNALNTVLKAQQNQEALNQHLFEALGFTDELVQKSLPETLYKDNPVNKNKPVQTMDTASVIKDVLTEVFKNIPQLTQNEPYRHPFNQKRDVRKNLRTIASAIHGK